MKILPHHVLNDKGESIELCSSVECKGIIGNDGRHYILDLLRTFPPDVNFLKCKCILNIIFLNTFLYFVVVDDELSKEVKLLGFPIEHKHKLCCLRQELIDSFVDSRYMMFIKYAAYHLQQINADKKKNEDVENTANIKSIEDGQVNEPNKEESDDKKDEKKNNQLEPDEAKKIVESITEGSKQECKSEHTK